MLPIAGILLLLGFSSNDYLLNVFYHNLGLNNNSHYQNYTLTTSTNSDNVIAPTYLLSTIYTCKPLQQNTSLNISDNNDLFTLVNNRFNYKEIPIPEDLVSLKALGIPTLSDQKLRLPAAINLKAMFTAMINANINATVSSGYRNTDDQKAAFRMWVNIVGLVHASEYAAIPGSSEHQLGTAVDIITYENNLKLLPSFVNTKLYSWLQLHAAEFGFVNSYPQGEESITGFAYEPWHYRYVGTDISNYLLDHDLTLTEYLYHLHNYCLMD